MERSGLNMRRLAVAKKIARRLRLRAAEKLAREWIANAKERAKRGDKGSHEAE